MATAPGAIRYTGRHRPDPRAVGSGLDLLLDQLGVASANLHDRAQEVLDSFCQARSYHCELTGIQHGTVAVTTSPLGADCVRYDHDDLVAALVEAGVTATRITVRRP